MSSCTIELSEVFQRKFPKVQDEDAKDTWVGIWGSVCEDSGKMGEWWEGCPCLGSSGGAPDYDDDEDDDEDNDYWKTTHSQVIQLGLLGVFNIILDFQI